MTVLKFWVLHTDLKINMPIPVQFLLYQTDEWLELLRDSGSYASAIEKKGTVLYGETSEG